jgi:hypothetical protein
MAIGNLTSRSGASVSEISLENSLFNTINPDLAPEVIAILDFLPLTDMIGENTPAGEIVDLRASMFIRNRNFVRRKFRGLFKANVGDETPDTLETLTDNDAERKLIEPNKLLKMSGYRLYRALGRNFDYYTDSSFQAIELLFSTAEIFAGAFDKIKNYSSTADEYDLADDISKYMKDLYYDADGTNISTKAGIFGDGLLETDLYNKVLFSLDSIEDYVELGDFDVDPALPTYFNEDSGKSTNDIIDALSTSDQIERTSFLFFTLGKAYAANMTTNQIDINFFSNTVKDIISPEKNSGYNFFREDSIDGEYMGYTEYLTNIFDDTVKNKKTSFDISKIMHIKGMLGYYTDPFIQYFYSSRGFFTEHTFIDNFYRQCGFIMDKIFVDSNDSELIDDLFIRILKFEPGGSAGIKEVAYYYDEYYRDNTYNEFSNFGGEFYKDMSYENREIFDGYTTSHDYRNNSLELANNNSYIFKAVRDMNNKWGDGTKETETCILLIILNILSIVAMSGYIIVRSEKTRKGKNRTIYYTDVKDNLGWKIGKTFDNKTSNKTSNELYDDLSAIYLRCAKHHYSVLRKFAGIKSVEDVFSKAADEISAIKYLNNEALAAASQHSHLLLDYNYKHAFRIRQFFDLLQQHEKRFTPQKFNLSKGGSYELLKSYMTEDKCKMSKKQQLDRKKKIFSIGIRNNAIKQAIKNSETISGDYVIKLKISIEKELAVFDGIKFKPLEFEFDLSSFAALNSYEIAGLTNGDERELLFETTDDIINSTTFDKFISNNMKLVKFKNSFTAIEDFMHFDDINISGEIIKNGVESDVLKEYIYRVYGIDMSETTFISDRKGADKAAKKIITTTLKNRFKNIQSLMLNKSIFFNGNKFTYEILQYSKFEKIINVLVDVENDFEVDVDNLELNDWSNANLLNINSTADHYDFKVSTEIIIEEAD